MPRGQNSNDGEVRIAQNGYTYLRCDGKWRLKHHIVAEAKLGRSLLPGEMVFFVDNDKTNFDPKNITVRVKGTSSIAKRIALIEVKIKELAAERERLIAEQKALKAKALANKDK